MFRLALAARLVLALCLLPAFSFAAEPNDGILPVGADGKPLNLDFETGTLNAWRAEGKAFDGQPVKGDSPTKRGRGMPSKHVGDYWIGGYEVSLSDQPQGTLTSAPFKITQPWASFRVGGGSKPDTRIDLLLADSGQPIIQVSGDDSETLFPVVVDLRQHQGKTALIHIVDESSGAWGHVNFDNFRFHSDEPKFTEQLRKAPLPLDDYPFDGLPPEQAAKAMTVPEGFSVKLFAGEPDVVQPIAMAHRRPRPALGRRGVLPIRSARRRTKAKDRILIFEDTDGDGNFDKRTVFAEGLNLVSGLEVGFGGVWVGAAPYLLFIPDSDGDDKPDGEPAGPARRLGLPGHARNAQHVHLGPRRLALRLPRRVHPLATSASRARPTTSARRSTPASGAITRRGTCSRSSPTARATPGASTSTTTARPSSPPASSRTCTTSSRAAATSGRRGQHFNPYTYDDIKTIADHRHYARRPTPHAGNGRSDAPAAATPTPAR